MAKNKIIFQAILSVLLTIISTCGAETQHQACQFWTNIADQMSKQNRSQMHCTSKGSTNTDTCTKIDCTGTYKLQSIFQTGGLDSEYDYCFGAVLNHCSEPISLDTYLQMPKRNITSNNRITHDQELQIPGASYSVTYGRIDVYIYFHMIKNTGDDTVEFSMKLKIKITTKLGLTLFPKPLQRVLIPKENIPVPPCTHPSTTQPPPLKLGICHPPSWKPDKDDKSPTYNKPTKKSLTYHKNCTIATDFESCGVGEGCDNKTKVCQCLDDFQYDTVDHYCVSLSRVGQKCTKIGECGRNEDCTREGICACTLGNTFNELLQMCTVDAFDLVTATTKILSPLTTAITKSSSPITTISPHVNITGKHSAIQQPATGQTSSTAIVIGCISAVVVIAAIVFGVYFFMKRKRSQYFNSRLLLINDDDDDPLVI